MKKSIIFSLSICCVFTFLSCGKKQNNYQVIESVSQPNDSMMIVNGIIAEQTGENTHGTGFQRYHQPSQDRFPYACRPART